MASPASTYDLLCKAWLHCVTADQRRGAVLAFATLGHLSGLEPRWYRAFVLHASAPPEYDPSVAGMGVGLVDLLRVSLGLPPLSEAPLRRHFPGRATRNDAPDVSPSDMRRLVDLGFVSRYRPTPMRYDGRVHPDALRVTRTGYLYAMEPGSDADPGDVCAQEIWGAMQV